LNKAGTIKVIKQIYEIEDTQGTNAKRAVLEKYADDVNFTDTIRFLFDTLNPTGIAARKLEKDWTEKAESIGEGIDELIAYLQEHNTGTSTDIGTVQAFAEQFLPKIAEGIYRLTTKNWPVGIDRASANKVYGDDFIPVFKVQLCQKYVDNIDYWNDGREFALGLKLDGFCFIAIKENGKVRLFSRSGKEMTGQFPDIENEMAELPVDNIVFHGERMPLGFLDMTNEQQFKLVGESTKKGEKHGVCIAVYDYIPLKQWKAQVCKMKYRDRYATYMKLLENGKYLFPLPNLYMGTDEKEIDKWFRWAKAGQKEGIIIKDLDAYYEWDRTVSSCKIKSVFDADLPIIGFEEGRNKYTGMLGALILDYNGTEVRVGSGLTDELRTEIWNNQDEYLGKIVEINYMEECKAKGRDAYKLRHHIFKCLCNDK
jgi:DNA ligase-1